jgi:hypothetical protein
MTPSEHAKQVALVKASMWKRPVVVPPVKPEYDMRRGS